MLNTFVNDISDPDRFKTDWLPKIQAYRDELNRSLNKAYFAPDEVIKDANKSYFDATKVPARVLSAKEMEITESSAVSLVDRMARSELSAVETLTAFIKRATIAHQLTNCAFQLFIDEGLARARELDQIIARTGKPVGPLHGLPISFKEQIGMKNKITHASYAAFIENITKNDAVSVQVLRNAGAVFFIRTTEPQCMMAQDSEQNITGRTLNPHNTSLSPGGSTSGEGALVAMGGSPMGVGTDSGGSIRAPAAYCGLWGFKPTSMRISMKGAISAGGGQETVVCSMGPLTRSGEEVDLFMRAYLDQQPWRLDSALLPLPWRYVEKPRPKELTIAIVYDDGIVRPHPPIERGLKYAEEKLRKAGVKVVTWEAHKVKESLYVAGLAVIADRLKAKKAISVSGEPVLPNTEWAFSKITREVSVWENHDLNCERDQLRDEYLSIMNENNIDYILGPTYAGVAPRPNTLKYGGYCGLWNILDMPGIVFPTGLVQQPDVDVQVHDYHSRSELEEYSYNLYKPEQFTNAPICLQLNGRRYDDERLVKTAQVLQELIIN